MPQNEEQEKETPPVEVRSDEFADTHLQREDDRWNPRAQIRDWLVLLLMIAFYLIWAGIIYFLEPGIR